MDVATLLTAVSTVLTAVQTLCATLQCREFRDICSVFGVKSKLENLERTARTVKAVLEDADANGVSSLPRQLQLYILELSEVVPDADALHQMFLRMADRTNNNNGVVGKMRIFRKIPAVFRLSRGVDSIGKKFDAIADSHNKFGFKLGSTSSFKRQREETCSLVRPQDIFGRNDDKDNLVSKLIDRELASDDVSCLTIVGIGGLGKTTLAQLIFNDQRIIDEFPTMRWVFIGDEDPKRLNIKPILAKILGLPLTREDTLDSLQMQVRDLLTPHKYLFVLDDIWIENRHEWCKLLRFFTGGHPGSWVLVTTRSTETARIVGNEPAPHELQTLSDEDSWRIFLRAAFGQRGQTAPLDSELAEIGRRILSRCPNVPLVIEVVGSSLYNQNRDKWLALENIEQNNILPLLKLNFCQFIPS